MANTRLSRPRADSPTRAARAAGADQDTSQGAALPPAAESPAAHGANFNIMVDLTPLQQEFLDWMSVPASQREAITGIGTQNEWERRHNLNRGECARWKKLSKKFIKAMNERFKDINQDPERIQVMIESIWREGLNDAKAAMEYLKLVGAYVPTQRTETVERPVEEMSDDELIEGLEDEIAAARARKAAR